jgi:ADP-ribose pyrophosphatase YjhB (NUDIX family)
MPVIDKLALIDIKDKRLLSARSKGKELFYLPGGKREAGESDKDALVREIHEELSVNLEPDSLTLYGVFSAQAHNHPEGVIVQMTCYTARYSGTVRASSEIAEIAWLGMADKTKTSVVDHIIMDQLNSEGLIN